MFNAVPDRLQKPNMVVGYSDSKFPATPWSRRDTGVDHAGLSEKINNDIVVRPQNWFSSAPAPGSGAPHFE